jgi:parallel beta-helix repeat protein
MRAKIRPAVVPATFVSVAVILALAVVGVIILGGGKAAAVQQLSCGDTITADATLHHNLVNCPNNGIIIGADNVTLDLNYHRIDGDGAFPAAGCGREDDCDLGVASIDHDGVTVVHGSVREFAIGVAVAGESGNARHNRVLDISSSKNDFFGIGIFGVARSVIRNSSSSRNVPPEGDGIGLFGSNHVRIVHNKIRHNPGPGIHVADSNENLIKRNVFSRNSPGILLGGDRFHADRNQIRRNRCARNSACVLVSPGTRNVIARNRISKGGDGIAIEKGHRNLVARNDIVGPRKAGVYLAIDRPPIGGHDNLIRRNFVRASGGDAFLVRSEDRHSRLKRNVAVGAGDDGFDVESRSARLTRNDARRNRDLGIEAVRGVHDGGGNVARHNGDLRQCTTIACN